MATYIEDLVQNIYTNCDMKGLDELNQGLKDAIWYSSELDKNLRDANKAQRQGFDFNARAIEKSKEAYTVEKYRLKLQDQQNRYRLRYDNLKAKYDEASEKRNKRENDSIRERLNLQKQLSRLIFAYIGINTIKSFVNTYRELDLTRRSIEGLTQSTQDWEYIQKEAFRTATDIEVVAKGYRNFYAAASMAGVNKSGVQNMYSNILEAGRAVGATQPQVQGALLALEQMFSKGRVSMEELRRQLGNALPGAFEVAAKAMGVTTQQFNEMIKKGVQATDLVPKFTEEYRKTFMKSFPEAMKSLDAALVNLSNSWKLFQYDIMKGGAGKELAKIIVIISQKLQSPSFHRAVERISHVLGIIFHISTYIAKNIELIMWLLAPMLVGTVLVRLKDIAKMIALILTSTNGLQVSLFRIMLIMGWVEEILAFFTDKEGLLESALMGKDQSWVKRLLELIASLALLAPLIIPLLKLGGKGKGKIISTGAKVATGGAIAKVATKGAIAKGIGSKLFGIGGWIASLAAIGNENISKMGINPMTVSPYGMAQPMSFSTPPSLTKEENVKQEINYSPKYEINATTMTPEQLKTVLDERDKNFWQSLLGGDNGKTYFGVNLDSSSWGQKKERNNQ